MATTITLKPTALFYRQSSSYWSSYSRAYDGDENTYATKVNSAAHFKVDLSSIPASAIIKSGYIRILYRRNGGTDNIPFGGFNYYPGTSSSQSPTTISNTDATLTSYQTKEWTATAAYTFTEAEQTAWRNAGTPCIWVNGKDGWVYEIEYVLTYEMGSKIYPGGTMASAVYKGSTQASAVYLGTNKIL